LDEFTLRSELLYYPVSCIVLFLLILLDISTQCRT